MPIFRIKHLPWHPFSWTFLVLEKQSLNPYLFSSFWCLKNHIRSYEPHFRFKDSGHKSYGLLNKLEIPPKPFGFSLNGFYYWFSGIQWFLLVFVFFVVRNRFTKMGLFFIPFPWSTFCYWYCFCLWWLTSFAFHGLAFWNYFWLWNSTYFKKNFWTAIYSSP